MNTADSPIKEVRYVDITPTWSAAVPIIVLGLTHGTAEGRRAAMVELARMARAADAYNASLPKDAPTDMGIDC